MLIITMEFNYLLATKYCFFSAAITDWLHFLLTVFKANNKNRLTIKTVPSPPSQAALAQSHCLLPTVPAAKNYRPLCAIFTRETLIGSQQRHVTKAHAHKAEGVAASLCGQTTPSENAVEQNVKGRRQSGCNCVKFSIDFRAKSAP